MNKLGQTKKKLTISGKKNVEIIAITAIAEPIDCIDDGAMLFR